MIERKYDNNLNIYFIKMYGDITLEDLMNFLEELWSEEHPSIMRLNYDMRDADFILASKDVVKLSDKSLNMITEKKLVKSAFIVDKPRQTALSVIFTNLSKFENIKREVFSTQKAALNWLKK